jgi:transposase InsO family protein
VKLKLRQKIQKLTGERIDGEPQSDDDITKDWKLDKLVRNKVKRFMRGSKGTKHQPGIAGLNDLQKLHCRLAHASKTAILAVLSSGEAKGLGTTYDACKDLEIGICDTCLREKTNAMNVPSSETTAETVVMPFEKLHMDIKDMTVPSLQGNRYTTYIIDEGSDKHYDYHSKTKMDNEEVIKQFVREEVLPSKHPMVRVLNADCDANFLDERFVEVCQMIGIKLKTSPPNVHQVNGRVERAIGADIKLMRTVMSRYNTPKDLWEMVIDHVIFTRNRLLSTVRKDKVSAEQRMSGEMQDLSIARSFDYKGEDAGRGSIQTLRNSDTTSAVLQRESRTAWSGEPRSSY